MSSTEDKDVGVYTWIIVILNGAALNLAVMIRELIGLYPINAFLACVPSSKPTRLVCVFSCHDQMKSPFDVWCFAFSYLAYFRDSNYVIFEAFHFVSE